jgi:hypothetical protein
VLADESVLADRWSRFHDIRAVDFGADRGEWPGE